MQSEIKARAERGGGIAAIPLGRVGGVLTCCRTQVPAHEEFRILRGVIAHVALCPLVPRAACEVQQLVRIRAEGHEARLRRQRRLGVREVSWKPWPSLISMWRRPRFSPGKGSGGVNSHEVLDAFGFGVECASTWSSIVGYVAAVLFHYQRVET